MRKVDAKKVAEKVLGGFKRIDVKINPLFIYVNTQKQALEWYNIGTRKR